MLGVVRYPQLRIHRLVQILVFLFKLAQRYPQVVDIVGLMLKVIFFNYLLYFLLRIFLFPLFLINFVNNQFVILVFDPS